jgi:hypothetical protein
MSAKPEDILSTPTHIRQLQQEAQDDDADYENIATGKTERAIGKINKSTKRRMRRKNYGTNLSTISPYRS